MADDAAKQKELQHPDNKKFSGEGWTGLRDKKRHCTDVLCTVRH
jgi:hypothetical protein